MFRLDDDRTSITSGQMAREFHVDHDELLLCINTCAKEVASINPYWDEDFISIHNGEIMMSRNSAVYVSLTMRGPLFDKFRRRYNEQFFSMVSNL